jgi:parallel beta-helix repeat protein
MGKLGLILIVLVSCSAQGATYYVDPVNGPIRTIVDGVSRLYAGDTLIVKAGTYSEVLNTNFHTLRSGTSWDNTVNIIGEPGAVWTCGGCQTLVNIATSQVNPVIQYVIFKGFIFDGIRTTFAPLAAGFSDGQHDTANYIRFQDNDIKNLPGGYAAQTYGKGIQFIKNKIHDSFVTGSHNGGTACGQSICWGYPLYWGTADGLIDGNDIYNFPSFALHMYNGAANTVNNNIVRNNKIHDFSTSYWPTPPPGAVAGGDPRGTAIILYSGANNRAYNNIIYNGSQGITVAGTGNQVYNNTIFNMTYGYGCINTESSVNAVIKNNIFKCVQRSVYQAFGTNVIFSKNLCNIAGTGCEFVDDPHFANEGTRDLHLTSASTSAINKAEPLNSVFTTDILGGPRGNTWDIGAYEFSTTASTSSPPQPPQNLKAQ